jgi:non-specific serine/threonine protein kinase/protein-serine/threonine kinase
MPMHGRVQAGQTVDGFLIGALLHEGGMSSLRSVTRPDVDIPILMKVPKLQEGMDPAAIVSFEMEQMILPRISGVHVPRFFAAGDFAVQPYIVMEHVPGETLLHKLDLLPLPYEEVAGIGAKVAAAIHDLHRQHVIHFDVKPSNILFRPMGEAVLIDFGLSRHEQLPDLMAEEFRIPYGTGPYLAPEQILGVRKDPRSDLFALGVLLYFFTTGKRPFGDPKSKRQLHKRLWRDPVPPRKLRADYPPWLQEIVLRCLEVDPSRRHPSAAQLAFDLSHPDQVKLTARSERLHQDPWTRAIKRRFNPQTEEPVVRNAELATQTSTAPIVAIALDLSDGSEALAEALRENVQRGLERLPDARFAILNVLKQHRIALDQKLDEDGQNKHLMRLVQLRHWAEKLDVAAHRISFHVLESPDPAAAILDYAETNDVDHIVLGARTNSVLRSILGSVSAEVAAKAPCTVTVVRPPRRSGRKERSDEGAEI